MLGRELRRVERLRYRLGAGAQDLGQQFAVTNGHALSGGRGPGVRGQGSERVAEGVVHAHIRDAGAPVCVPTHQVDARAVGSRKQRPGQV